MEGQAAWWRGRRAAGAGAFLTYLAASVAMFGLRVLPHPARRLVGGTSSDTDFFVWALRWWPWAIEHGVNPFVPRVVWAPTGYNLAWATGVPVPGVAAAPVTAAFGPVVAFNVLSLLAPALGAWTAYLLCRRLTGAHLASLAGGFVYGFSAYLVHTVALGHLDLSLVFLLPLAAYLVLRRVEGSLGPVAFVVLLGVVLALQFGTFPEVFATMTLMAAIVAALALAFAPRSWPVIARTAGLAVLAYGLALVLVSPLLYAMVAYARPVKRLHPVSDLAHFARSWADAVHLVVPGQVTALGRSWVPPDLRARVGENGSYLGLPLILVVGLFAVTEWRRATARVAAAAFVVAAALSLGPAWRIGSHVVALPWRAVEFLPLYRRAVPGRVIAYAFLIGAVVLALWAARGGWLRWSVVALAVLATIPNLSPAVWSAPVDSPPFVATGQFRRHLSPGGTVLVIAGRKGAQMLWQAQSGMWFSMAGGYLGGAPPDFAGRGQQAKLVRGELGSRPGSAEAFLRAHRVGAILISGRPPEVAARLAAALGARPVEVGGITLIRLPYG